MKKIILVVVMNVIIPLNVFACAVEEKSAAKPHTVETVQKPLSEKERDHLMFTGFLGILVNFIKLFLDPTNIPEAKQNAYNIVMGVYNLAHVITRSGLTPEMQDELVRYIIKSCQDQHKAKMTSNETV